MPKREDYQLRKLKSSDLEMVLNWRNSDRIRANMYTDQIITLEEHLAWYDKIKDDSSRIYLICEYQNQPIGLVNFTNIDKKNNKCDWGFYLGEIDAPLGSGIMMEFLALEYAFEKLNIRKLCCEVLSFNNKVVKLHKKFYFEEEGIFKKHIYKNNEYNDVICLALFKDRWLENQENLSKIVFKN